MLPKERAHKDEFISKDALQTAQKRKYNGIRGLT